MVGKAAYDLLLTRVLATGQEERNKLESSAAKALLLTSSGARARARALLLTSLGARAQESKSARERTRKQEKEQEQESKRENGKTPSLLRELSSA
jgi:hypothetical protein